MADDFYFEREYYKRKRVEVEEGLDKDIASKVKSDLTDKIETVAEARVLKDLDIVMEEFYRHRLGRSEKDDEICALSDEFLKGFDGQAVVQMYNEHSFTDEEMDYIRYTQLTKSWRGQEGFNVNGVYAIRDILLREYTINKFGEVALPYLVQAAGRVPVTFLNVGNLQHFAALFSNHPYGDNIKKDLSAAIIKETKQRFNGDINCGGYAFRVDKWVEPQIQLGNPGMVANLLEEFPFIRLMDEGKIGDDEYLVIFRCNDQYGHHFVRIDSDGVAREKDTHEVPKFFNGWDSNFENSDEVVFAVKKDHKMFGYPFEDEVKEITVPDEVIEYMRKPRKRPILANGRMQNYSDFVASHARTVGDNDDYDAR